MALLPYQKAASCYLCSSSNQETAAYASELGGMQIRNLFIYTTQVREREREMRENEHLLVLNQNLDA